MKKFIVLLLIVGALTVFLWWENCAIQTEVVHITLPELPEEFDGLRIVEIADLHGRSFGGNNSDLLCAVASAEPDLICIDGDLFDADSDLSFLAPLCTGLVSIAPTYYVTGNHEWEVPKLHQILRMMSDRGVHVLRDNYVLLQNGGSQIAIAGVDDPCGPAERKTPQALVNEIRQKAEFICMLSHRNNEIEMWSRLDVDLVLTGHCHGGVLRLPFFGGVFGADRTLFPDYDAGLYQAERTFLYVSRGLGFSRINLRLMNRPHLPVLVLHSGQS